MKNPVQPTYSDKEGIHRFKENKIVRRLLDHPGTPDLNEIATWDVSEDDRAQFAQLIGYSISGAWDLEYFLDEIITEAEDGTISENELIRLKAENQNLEEENDDLRRTLVSSKANADQACMKIGRMIMMGQFMVLTPEGFDILAEKANLTESERFI